MENTIKSLETRVRELNKQLAHTTSKETSNDAGEHEQIDHARKTNKKLDQINSHPLFADSPLSSLLDLSSQTSSLPRAPDSDPLVSSEFALNWKGWSTEPRTEYARSLR